MLLSNRTDQFFSEFRSKDKRIHKNEQIIYKISNDYIY